MNQNIKNFIEESEKNKLWNEFREYLEEDQMVSDYQLGSVDIDKMSEWWLEKLNQRQISLIKMIVK